MEWFGCIDKKTRKTPPQRILVQVNFNWIDEWIGTGLYLSNQKWHVGEKIDREHGNNKNANAIDNDNNDDGVFKRILIHVGIHNIQRSKLLIIINYLHVI